MKRAVRGLGCALGLLLIAGAFPAAAGCQNSAGPRQQMRILPAGQSFEKDIPLPAGFRIVESASEDRATGTKRLYLRHVYEGPADKYAVINFYLEQMPLARWTVVSRGMVAGESMMRFEKESESCTVMIRDGDRGFGTSTQVHVMIVQEERGAAPPGGRERA